MEQGKTLQNLEEEISGLRWQLEEANDTIEAIRTGQIDALIVKEETGHQLYTLKSADQTYRVFIEKMKEGAITLDRDGLILYCNSRFATMLSEPLSNVIGRSFAEFVFKDHTSIFNNLLQQGWKIDSKGEILLFGHDKKVLPVLLSLATLELDEGTALSIIVTDLSAQKQTERQLKSKNEELMQAHNSLEQLYAELEDRVEERTRELSISREHFKFLADHIPVIVWTARPNGEVDYFNKRWFDYTGNSLKESLGAAWTKAIHNDDLDDALKTMNESLAAGKDFKIEYRFLRAADETYRWHSSMAVPFKNDDGEIIEWFGISTDIEEQKLAMIKKDEFISMASHELKTPVTTLKAFTQLLLLTLEKENNIKAANYLFKMDKQINKLTGLIADLLDATKINAGVLHFEKEIFDFNGLVSEVVDQMQLTSETHKITLALSESHQIPGDRNRIGQVISNLISNAFKYSPKADEIIITSEVKDKKQRLNVQDFGIGIPEDQQSKLFNRFFRASEVKSNTFPGLGLGLYISNEIIKRHTGSLTFISQEGKGSTFSIELPINNLPV